jgi:hypothetical protein
LAGRRPRPLAQAASNDDAEVAVFRFTLGNDDLDALVPRIVGVAGATLLVLNHLQGGEPSEAQARGRQALMAIACMLAASVAPCPTTQPAGGKQADMQ